MQVEMFAVVEPQQHGGHGGLPVRRTIMQNKTQYSSGVGSKEQRRDPQRITKQVLEPAIKTKA